MLTLCDWQLALAAYAYEVRDISVMTDFSYDRMCRDAAARGTELPDFGADTGQWVHQMDHDILGRVLDHALSLNQGKVDLHGPAIRAALDHFGLTYGCCIRQSLSTHDCW